MKKCIAMLLALALTVSLVPAALAAEPVTPTPPEWINEEDYIIFPGDEVYLPKNWEKVEQLREAARNGATKTDNQIVIRLSDTVAGNFEAGLAALRCAENLEKKSDRQKGPLDSAYFRFREALDLWEKQNGGVQDETWKALRRWFLCATFLQGYSTSYLDDSLRELNMTLDEFFELPFMHLVSQEDRERKREELAVYRNRVAVWLDGYAILREGDGEPEAQNNRIMVPLRAIAETLGADVEWIAERNEVILTRAGVTIALPIGGSVAKVNGKEIALDAPCYAKNGRTLVPVRFVSEAFGQSVVWDGDARIAYITEDKTVAGDSNLEAWALPMAAAQHYYKTKDTPFGKREASVFGESGRCGHYIRGTTRAYEYFRSQLMEYWNINSREGLIQTVTALTLRSYDAVFRETAAEMKNYTVEEREKISLQSPADWPSYMWAYTEQLDEKWGDRGIMAWDLFWVSNLAQWGYTAGYVTYAEALELLEPAATLLSENFSSWEEAYENYLDGYCWLTRADVMGQDIWKTERGVLYSQLRKEPKVASIFDDTLFQTGVIPLPGSEG